MAAFTRPFCLVFILVISVAPSEQKRKPDRNNYVLEISEAGEVKQIPVIQPALDAISGLWTSLAGSDRPSKPSSVGTVKPTKVVPVTVKATGGPAGQKPSKGKHKVTPSGTVATTKKVVVRSSSVASVVTVTPKTVPVSSTEITTTTTTTMPTTTQTTTTTTTTSTGRALEDKAYKQVVPIEFFLRLQQLLLKIRQYNKEIAIPVFSVN